MSSPLVSVSMTAYNHEAYVGEAIQSVLSQTLSDWELVVVNDGSTDGTRARIDAFADPRITAIHQANQGPGAAMNRAFAACRGKYVAIFSGDDVCHPDRLERQLEEYGRGGKRVLFAACDFIDDSGHAPTEGHFAAPIFDGTNRNRAQTLARFFHHGNYINAVTAFTERAILAEAPFDPALLQLQDFDVWLRLAKRYDFWIMPDRLIGYRVRNDHGNLSSPSPDTLARLQNEYYLILLHFFDDIPAELFREAFAAELVVPDFADGIEYACEQAFAYCRSRLPLGWLIGVERLHGMLSDPATAEVLSRRYDFTPRRFFALLGSIHAIGSFDGAHSTLFFDTGSGWRTEEQVSQRVFPADETFNLTFRLPIGARPRALRWDPLELHTCRVRIDGIEMIDAAGRSFDVDPATIESNGQRSRDGTVSFQTGDPMFCWPVDGEVAGVVIRGWWQTDKVLNTVLTLTGRINELTSQLAGTQQQLRSLSTRYRRLTAPFRAMRAVARRLKAG
jgi:glycosyltransferase involved in cell wall biosynthesis